MSYAVQCGECEETVWPPHDATGPGGQTAFAAHELALVHVRESGHTAVRVQAGCYYVGGGRRPTAFGEGTTDPADVAVPKRADLADCVADSARTLRDVAESIDDHVDRGGDTVPGYLTRHLREYAEAVETHLTDEYDRDGDRDPVPITPPGDTLDIETTTTDPADERGEQ